jgi:hypothetical protein
MRQIIFIAAMAIMMASCTVDQTQRIEKAVENNVEIIEKNGGYFVNVAGWDVDLEVNKRPTSVKLDTIKMAPQTTGNITEQTTNYLIIMKFWDGSFKTKEFPITNQIIAN